MRTASLHCGSMNIHGRDRLHWRATRKTDNTSQTVTVIRSPNANLFWSARGVNLVNRRAMEHLEAQTVKRKKKSLAYRSCISRSVGELHCSRSLDNHASNFPIPREACGIRVGGRTFCTVTRAAGDNRSCALPNPFETTENKSAEYIMAKSCAVGQCVYLR